MDTDRRTPESRTTVLVEVRRGTNPNRPTYELGRIPIVGEYALFGDHLTQVTHVIHVEGQPSKNRPGTHAATGTEYRHNGRVAAVVYVNEVSGIPGLEIEDISDLEPR